MRGQPFLDANHSPNNGGRKRATPVRAGRPLRLQTSPAPAHYSSLIFLYLDIFLGFICGLWLGNYPEREIVIWGGCVIR